MVILAQGCGIDRFFIDLAFVIVIMNHKTAWLQGMLFHWIQVVIRRPLCLKKS